MGGKPACCVISAKMPALTPFPTVLSPWLPLLTTLLPMSDREDALVFDGEGPLTSGQFLRIVRTNAIEKDKTTDDQWIAFYAASRMDGTALAWLEDQSEEMQESWKLLRRAILIRWPMPAQQVAVEPVAR